MGQISERVDAAGKSKPSVKDKLKAVLHSEGMAPEIRITSVSRSDNVPHWNAMRHAIKTALSTYRARDGLTFAATPNAEVRLFNPFPAGRSSATMRFVRSWNDLLRVDPIGLVHSKNRLQERSQLSVGVRQNMRDILVWTDHDQRAPFAVDAALVEDTRASAIWKNRGLRPSLVRLQIIALRAPL